MTTVRFSSRCIAFLFVAALAVLLAAPRIACAQSDSKMGDSKMADSKMDATPKMSGNPSAIRIKAGSDKPFTDHDGNVWMAEVGFDGGETIDRPDDMKIENTKDPGLYRSEHYSMDSFSQKVPNGKYKVNLHFAETFDEVTEPGGRVFSFKVGDKEFKDFDVVKKAGGPQKAYVESVDVDVKDGMLKITFTPNVQNPEINAIEIIPAKM
jgi:Malectin domain